MLVNCPKGLVALAVSLDGDFVQLGLGDDGDLGVECDARKKGGDFKGQVVISLLTLRS